MLYPQKGFQIKLVTFMVALFFLAGCDVERERKAVQQEAQWEQQRQERKQLRRQQRSDEQNKGLNALIGTSKHDLILKNGPADRVSSDGAGGEVLTYAKSHTYGTFIYGMYVQNTNLKYIEIYCDPDGKIYQWRAN